MKKILISLFSLMMAVSMMAPAFAEDTAATATDTASALSEAQEAYAAAKQTSRMTDYEAELKAMVEAGTLTQEQADLLLTAAREQNALRSGVCPNCGYEFQTAANSKSTRKTFGKNSRKQTAASTDSASSDDTTALEQAQAAYSSAKQASSLSDYEAELKAMVEAGTLTQEQADLLLNAAKEADALANGICPSCGYQFQTVTVTTNSRSNGKNGNHGGKH